MFKRVTGRLDCDSIYLGGIKMKSELELETPRKVELLEVIHTEAVRGKGTNENPVRVVHQYWDKDGNLLAEKDDCK